MTVIVTAHAVERYVERVDPSLSLAQARDTILRSSRVIEAAAAFGCTVIRLGSGAKLVLEGDAVVTVLPRHWMAAGHLAAQGARL